MDSNSNRFATMNSNSDMGARFSAVESETYSTEFDVSFCESDCKNVQTPLESKHQAMLQPLWH